MKRPPLSGYDWPMAPSPRNQELLRNRRRQAESLLVEVLRETETFAQASAIWLTWPLAKTLAMQISWFLTNRVLHPSGYTLLSLCIVKAFKRFEERCSDLGSAQDIRCLVAFVRGALEALPAVIEVRVRSGIQEWDPLSGQPLGEFLEANPRAVVEQIVPDGEAAERNPEALRLFWLSQLLAPDDMAALAEHVEEITTGSIRP